MLAWFLPPNGSLTVTGLDNRLALALFFLGTVVGSIGRGRKSVAQPLDYNFGSGSMNITEEWCRRGESNPRPRDYETLALPLSYAGMKQSTMLRIRLRRCQGIVPGARSSSRFNCAGWTASGCPFARTAYTARPTSRLITERR